MKLADKLALLTEIERRNEERIRQRAAEEGITLSALIEKALRQ